MKYVISLTPAGGSAKENEVAHGESWTCIPSGNHPLAYDSPVG